MSKRVITSTKSTNYQHGHVMCDSHGNYYRVHVQFGHTGQRIQVQQCGLNEAVLIEHLNHSVRDEMSRLGLKLVPVVRTVAIETIIDKQEESHAKLSHYPV